MVTACPPATRSPPYTQALSRPREPNRDVLNRGERTEESESVANRDRRFFIDDCHFAARAVPHGGLWVTKPGQVRSAIRPAPGHPGPALADVNQRQHGRGAAAGYGRYGQAKNFALALLPSQPERATIAATLLPGPIQQRHAAR